MLYRAAALDFKTGDGCFAAQTIQMDGGQGGITITSSQRGREHRSCSCLETNDGSLARSCWHRCRWTRTCCIQLPRSSLRLVMIVLLPGPPVQTVDRAASPSQAVRPNESIARKHHREHSVMKLVEPIHRTQSRSGGCSSRMSCMILCLLMAGALHIRPVRMVE